MANDVGVRSYLQGKGVASGDIGYDQNSGYVQVRGQNFLKPAANFSGTTYDSQPNLDNAYNTYAKARPVIQADGTVGTSMNGQVDTGASITPKTEKQPQRVDPYAQQIAEIMKHLNDQTNGLSQPVDPYSSPQYAAAQAQQQKNAQQSTRAAQESMGQSGFARSTNLADRAQGIQNDANDYITTQIVPQIIAQLQQEKQQGVTNTRNQLNDILALADREDNQYNADRTFNYNASQDKITNDRNAANDEASATGNYTSPEDKALQQKMDANSAAYASASPEERDRLHAENVEIGNQLGKKFDKQTGTYVGGKPKRTIAGQQLDAQVNEVAYNHARDSLLDKRYETEFANNVRQQGFENALKIAIQKHQISNDNAQLAISQQNANTNASQAATSAANVANDNSLQREKFEWEKSQNTQNPALSQELDGLYTGITSGQITASAAIDEINGKVKAKLITPTDAVQMLTLISSVTTSMPNVTPKLTQDQIEANGGNPQDLNTAQLEKLWNTDPTGRAAGRPSIDWADWYKDPRGRVGGFSYESWKKAYGPQLVAHK